MKVKDLIAQDIDIDVYDDVCEELAVAFVGPQTLTEAGKKKFAEVLEYDVELCADCCVVSLDDPDETIWKRRLRRAKTFFEAMAGYCAVADYDAWYEEES